MDTMRHKISGRTWLSIATIIILAVVLYTARHDILQAWQLMQRVNIWLLIGLLIPLQFFSYYSLGETLFAYLRSQGSTSGLGGLQLARLSLEMNFVNHVLPSAGVSGISYMGWRLRHFGIPVAKSTTAQLVRIVAGFAGYAIVLVVAALWMLLDGSLNRWVTLATAVLVCLLLGSIALIIITFSHQHRMEALAKALVRLANGGVRLATFGRRTRMFTAPPVVRFLTSISGDYQHIRANKHVMLVPLLWGVLLSLSEIGLYYVSFLVLGSPINPAPLVVAYGIAALAGLVMITPGGAGLYEAIMVGFLALVGVNPTVGIAGIVLTRVLLIVGTIVGGYPFYQAALVKHGRRPQGPRE